ncbi:MAG: hypothetical protein K9K75_01980 [Deltaproteobacteria bacterium]|nr:hypothetical protein [Deltaproteobacteria bacterium]
MFLYRRDNNLYFSKVTLVIVALAAFAAGLLFAPYLQRAVGTKSLESKPAGMNNEAVKHASPTDVTVKKETPSKRAMALQEETVARKGAGRKSKDVINREAEEAIRKREYATAVGLYKALLEKDPHNAYLYRYHLGKTYRLMEEYGKEMISYRLSLRLNPDNDDAYVAQGEGFERDRIYKEAISSYKKALEVNPHSEIAKARLEDLAAKVANVAEAQ